MKRTQKLILLFGSFALMLGLYLIMANLNGEKVSENQGKNMAVREMEPGSIKEISYAREGETVTLTRDSQGGWSYAGDPGFPLDESFPATMVSTLANLKASQVFKATADLADYGLENPAIKITLTLDDGTEAIYFLGNENQLTGEYYLCMNTDNSIYMVDSSVSSAFGYGLMDLVLKEDIPSVGTANGLTLETGQHTIRLTAADDQMAAWFIESDGMKEADPDKVLDLIDSVLNLSWAKCVAYKGGDDALSLYGLDHPQGKITVSGKGDGSEAAKKEFTLLIGGKADGYYYAKLADSALVYLIDQSTADRWLQMSSDELYH